MHVCLVLEIKQFVHEIQPKAKPHDFSNSLEIHSVALQQKSNKWYVNISIFI